MNVISPVNIVCFHSLLSNRDVSCAVLAISQNRGTRRSALIILASQAKYFVGTIKAITASVKIIILTIFIGLLFLYLKSYFFITRFPIDTPIAMLKISAGISKIAWGPYARMVPVKLVLSNVLKNAAPNKNPLFIKYTIEETLYTTDRYDTSKLKQLCFKFLMPPFTKVNLWRC